MLGGGQGLTVETLLHILKETWSVTALMAPYLLFGFLMAGALSVWISPQWLERHLGGGGAGPVVKATLFGIPLPLCSCGVIPVAASLRRHGASRSATVSFLLSTPQTGLDSILATYAVLGPLFAIYRPLVALWTGLIGGGMVQVLEGPAEADAPSKPPADDTGEEEITGFAAKVRAALRYALVVLPRDIGGALVVGVLVAGALSALVPPHLLQEHLGTGLLPMLVLMAAGVPLYVCATASVPIAAGFLYVGATPGAALAFLVVGPATNAATITTVWRVLGKRVALIYLGTVVGSALVGGWLLDQLAPWTAENLPALSVTPHHGEGIGLIESLFGLALLAVLVGSWYAGRRKGGDVRTDSCKTSGSPERIDLTVDGMNCSHCRSSVERALSEVKGVTRVTVDLEGGKASVEGAGLEAAVLIQAVDGLGYKAARGRST